MSKFPKPLFAAQYAAGDQLYKKGSAAPDWAQNSHGVLAAGVAGLFALNTITGGLNWWETRRQEKGRTWRTVHAAMMLAADVPAEVAAARLGHDPAMFSRVYAHTTSRMSQTAVRRVEAYLKASE